VQLWQGISFFSRNAPLSNLSDTILTHKTYLCIHACVHACLYVCVFACIYVCMYANKNVCVCVCVTGLVFDDLEAQFLTALRSDAVTLRTTLNNVLPECVVQRHDFKTILPQRSNWFVRNSSVKGTYGSLSYLEHLQQVCFADVCCSLHFQPNRT
jgi:hypothetical protein